MKIQQEIFKQILENSPTPPPEVGGIIGGKDNIITCYFADKGSKDNCYDSYYPDVVLLNKQISVWKKNDIDFYGIYHTHFEGDNVLSYSDRKYIINIMQAMPDYISQLYFPIVFKNSMLVYKAIKKEYTIQILEETLEII